MPTALRPLAQWLRGTSYPGTASQAVTTPKVVAALTKPIASLQDHLHFGIAHRSSGQQLLNTCPYIGACRIVALLGHRVHEAEHRARISFLAWPGGLAERGCDRHRIVNFFWAVLNRLAPHFRVRGHMLLLSQDHPLDRVEIDLRQIASHKIPGLTTIRLRLLRSGWMSYSMADTRPSEAPPCPLC